VGLTSDREPTKNSEWKVINSYEGGCPANVPGSIGGGSASGLWLGLGSTVVAIVRCI
jgi:hypothetical protein